MNKIILEQDEKNFQDEKCEICINTSFITLNITGDVYLRIIKIFKDTILNINLNANSKLDIELDFLLKNNRNNINIVNGENSKLNLNFASLYQEENEIIINNDIKVDNSITNIHFRGVDDNGKLTIKATGKIFKNTKNNKYLEDIRVITSNNNFVKIMPDLLVDSNSVEANHNATISKINPEYIFYLTSKGMDKETAKNLLRDGFLKSILKK